MSVRKARAHKTALKQEIEEFSNTFGKLEWQILIINRAQNKFYSLKQIPTKRQKIKTSTRITWFPNRTVYKN